MCKNRTWHLPIQNTHKDQQRPRSRIVNLYQQNLKTNFMMFYNERTVINIITTQKLFKSPSDLNVTEWKYVPFIECLYQIGTSDIFNVTQTVPGINPILRLKDWDSERLTCPKVIQLISGKSVFPTLADSSPKIDIFYIAQYALDEKMRLTDLKTHEVSQDLNYELWRMLNLG